MMKTRIWLYSRKTGLSRVLCAVSRQVAGTVVPSRARRAKYTFIYFIKKSQITDSLILIFDKKK
jgi:hypothetical protein